MLLPRQDSTGDPAFESDDDYYYDSFWYSNAGIITKYIIFGILMLIFLIWFIGGYIHAQKRMKKGLAPLPYHKWLVPRYQRARFEPQMQGVVYYPYQHGQPQYYAPGQGGYAMQAYPEPPPMYNHQDLPPSYQPPPGASKVDPQQQYSAPAPGYAPPPGPPPSSSQGPQGPQQSGVVSDEPAPPAQAHHTGSSNPFRL